MMTTRSILAGLLLLALGSACSDNPMAADAKDDTGTFAFEYSGTVSGTYSAKGILKLDDQGRPKELDEHAIAVYRSSTQDGDSVLHVGGFKRMSDSTANVAGLHFFSKPTKGTHRLDVEKCGMEQMSLKGCVLAGVSFNQLLSNERNVGETYVFNGGTLTLTRVDGEWVEGTFSGTAVRKDSRTGEVIGTLTITNGRFRTPVVPWPETGTDEGGSFPNRIPFQP